MPPKTSDKLEKEVRAIAKLPGNKQCVDCGEKLPQYADLTHFTFVCTRCSGIHREFSWKIKGISMSVFTEDEAKALKRGGNEKCNARFLARYDPRRFHPPNPQDTAALREFIRMKYIDRKWYGEGREERAPSVDSESKEAASTVSRPSFGSSHEDKPVASSFGAPAAAPAVVETKPKQPNSAAQDLLDLMTEPVPVVQPAHQNGWGAAPGQQMNAFGQPAQPPAGAGVFGASAFGAAPQANAFGAFGAPAAPPTSAGFDAFGQPQANAWQTNGFHQPGAAGTNAFAAAPANAFGQPQPQPQPFGSAFGAPHADHFGGAGAFGAVPQQPAVSGGMPGMFGGAAPVATAPAPTPAPAAATPQPAGDKFSAFDDIPAPAPAPSFGGGSNPFDTPAVGGGAAPAPAAAAAAAGGNPFGGPAQPSHGPSVVPGMQVMYADMALGQYFPAHVVQVHHEAHPPYVTIRFPTGQERQTEIGRLVIPQQHQQQQHFQHAPQHFQHAPQHAPQAQPQQPPQQQPDPFGALAGAAWDSARAGAGVPASAGPSRSASVASDPFGDVGGAGMGFGSPSSVPAGKSQNPFDMF